MSTPTATSPQTRRDRGPDPVSGPLPFATSQAGAILAGMATTPGSAFIGRTHELARLLELLEQVESGRPAVALVAGEAGVGKTRLLAELAARASRGGARVLVGCCLPPGRTAPSRRRPATASSRSSSSTAC